MGREGHCKQISLAYVGSVHSVRTTLGLPRLRVACASWVYTAQAPGRSCLQGYCPKRAFLFGHFTGLSRSGSWVLHKGTESVGCAFCALPRSKQLRRPGASREHWPRWAVRLNHLPGPGRLVSWVRHISTISGVGCVSSGELISGCSTPGRCQLSRIPGGRG